jgi:hypothetical protein
VLRSWVGHIDPKTLYVRTHIADKIAQRETRQLMRLKRAAKWK